MISKGGANQYHGDVFEYLRNSALNARNFFDGAKIPQLEKNNVVRVPGSGLFPTRRQYIQVGRKL